MSKTTVLFIVTAVKTSELEEKLSTIDICVSLEEESASFPG
jgi:hypothetical protein